MPLNAREKELSAHHLLAHLDEISLYLKQHRWEELAALVEFVQTEPPHSMALTDPALYRMLRNQITEYHTRGWDRLNLEELKRLANPPTPEL